MQRFFRSRAFKALVCVLVALTCGAVIAAFTHNNSTPLSSATAVILQPAQRLSSYVSYKLSNFNDSFRSASTLKKENEELRKELDDYRQQVIGYNEAKSKLETYEEFLGVKEDNPDFVFANATIISRDSTAPEESFTLNKGSNADIAVNDPVIFGANLIGVVTGVTPTSCTVSTIADPDVCAGVYESYTGEVGFTEGMGAAENNIYCKIPGIKTDSEISPNGIICTTGSGGVFPKDLIVGTVVTIEDSKDGISSFATVRSAVNFDELSEVFVIIDFDGQGVITTS